MFLTRPFGYALLTSVLAATFVITSGCSPAKMRVDQSLTELEELQVSGRQGLMRKQRVRFGNYDTHQLRRSWTHGRGFSLLGYTRESRHQSYTYLFREDGEPRYAIGCEAQHRIGAIDIGIGEIEEQNAANLHCRIASVDHPEEIWYLNMREDRGRPMNGRLMKGDVLYEIIGTNRFQGKSLPIWEAAGYHVMEGSQALASIEVINRGAVRLSRKLSDEGRDAISAVASAVLLYQDLRD